MKPFALLKFIIAIAVPLNLLSACTGKSKDDKTDAKMEKIDKGASKSKKKKMKKDGSKKEKKPKATVAAPPPATPAP